MSIVKKIASYAANKLSTFKYDTSVNLNNNTFDFWVTTKKGWGAGLRFETNVRKKPTYLHYKTPHMNNFYSVRLI